jgi:hypothetical protein
MLTEYSRVRLTTNKFVSEGACDGMFGYVIEVYGDGKYEVEFSDPATGCTLAQLVLGDEDIITAPEQSGG